MPWPPTPESRVFIGVDVRDEGAGDLPALLQDGCGCKAWRPLRGLEGNGGGKGVAKPQCPNGQRRKRDEGPAALGSDPAFAGGMEPSPAGLAACRTAALTGRCRWTAASRSASTPSCPSRASASARPRPSSTSRARPPSRSCRPRCARRTCCPSCRSWRRSSP